jgi:ethanolamine utilization protein EutN
MQLGKIVGTVVSTRKDEKLEGLTLQVVSFIDDHCAPIANSFIIAVDSVGAGVGEIVLVATGSSARQTKTTEGKPVDGTIMAIVDQLEIGGKTRYTK